MKLLLKPNTETHKKVMALFHRIKECDEKALEAVKAMGGIKSYLNSGSSCIAGQVDAIQFPDGLIPDKALWKRVGKVYQNLWYPKAKNKADCHILENTLEKVKRSEINDIMKFKPHGAVMNGGLAFIGSLTTEVNLEKGVCVFTVEEGVKYEPIDDLEEILASRATKLIKGEESIV